MIIKRNVNRDISDLFPKLHTLDKKLSYDNRVLSCE